MKKGLTIFIATLLLQSCSKRYYSYKFELIEPVPTNPPLHYENDTLSIDFDFKAESVGFSIKNKINDGIKITWDDVSLSLNKKSYRVVHKETGMTKINDLQPPTTIAPQSTLRDVVVPSEKVRIMRVGGTYVSSFNTIFPNYGNKKAGENILKNKGKSVVLFMPFRIADKYVAKTFYFTVADIIPTKRKEF